jgi:hypothetical protein
MSETYPPLITELLAIPHRPALDHGSPNRGAGDRLRGLEHSALFAPQPVRDQNMTAACLAGLWLRFDFLDESHRISQGIETPEGSAWHAIMHRREGDFGNSKYWWRRVGGHPAFKVLAADERDWDPFAFVDAVEAHLKRGSGDEAQLLENQRREWDALFDHCCRASVGD